MKYELNPNFPVLKEQKQLCIYLRYNLFFNFNYLLKHVLFVEFAEH